MKGAI
jgi:hypothetical protein